LQLGQPAVAPCKENGMVPETLCIIASNNVRPAIAGKRDGTKRPSMICKRINEINWLAQIGNVACG
jgi:hypothetical protein